MKLRTIISVAALLVACSDAPEKSNNGTPNNTGDECTDNSDCAAAQECVDGSCLDHLECNPGEGDGECPPGQFRAEVNGEMGCYDECVNGVCPEGQDCLSGLCIGAAVDDVCSVQWANCSDDKTYQVSCTNSQCVCTVNDVDGASFDATVDCTDSTFHREVNRNCGWLVPKYE